ncbi:MAG TPA: hypothetical protein VGK67_02590 [Myxococcales bacterium]|jgi:hypothetical protein
MDPTPFLRPTALQHMRGFLAQSGAELPPWSTSDQVMDELVGLLHLHRGDDAFFARLVPFLEELREHASRGDAGLTAKDAEVLSRATVEAIVGELQAQLRTASRSASAKIVPALLGQQASRLLCLALLSSGLAACTQRPAEDGAAGEPGTAAPLGTKPGTGSLPAPSSEPGTPVPPPAKPVEGGTDALVEMFKAKTPQEAAKALERALDAGTPPDAAKAKPRVKPEVIVDPGIGGIPTYKGVNLT